MKLVKKQLKKLFNNDKTLVFVQVKKLDCLKLLEKRNKLLKKKIKLKIISNKTLKQFFSNITSQSFLNFFQGEIIILYSKNLDLTLFCKTIYSTFDNIYHSFLYNENRFFLIPSLFQKIKNENFISLLKVSFLGKFLSLLVQSQFSLVQILHMNFLIKQIL